jgi:DNA polymerase-3 subunit gamma/tau
VSPRFELETLASKLCWLDLWVSPADLAGAVAKAGNLLKGGLARPLAEGPGANFGAKPGEKPEPASKPVEEPRTVKDEIKPGQPGFLTEGFKRYIAEKQEAPQLQPEPERDTSGKDPSASPSEDAGVETVLRLFNGTIVK